MSRPFSLKSPHSTLAFPLASTSRSYSRARTRFQARQQKKRRAADAITSAAEAGTPEPILGHIIPGTPMKRSSSSRSAPPAVQPWDNCRLQKTLIHPQSIWNLPVPDYASGEKPRHLLPGLSGGDREMIFGAVPHVASALKYDPDVRAEVMAEVMEEQDKQSEMLMRILDLRNASRERINAVNRDRVVEEFGEGWNTGSSNVQGGSLALLIMENTDGWEAALMTTKIRGLNEHILANPKDVHNKRSLRMLVQKRARVLKYLKRTKPDEYERTLADIGLDRRTVEGELFIDL